ncbi:hypothetical protein C1X72_17835 [Pseudomonas sp. FW306-2-2C-D06B]|uniref:hypothetical protein n=1 Tax=unclassified Pseudomonas TaxID=196821 RepID=UPI000C886169|nr:MULTISPECIES: hypothetical protein [unclassified Pseudomonas]PMY79862.1 hypothetical protein C1X72_17835 [Pseudomonas sp. FW306-2-2C-D06B]PNA98426.1 hypothetical protein C1X74_11650 [Pseudomonas sp. GW460-5]PNB58885.1 hypothetical protein C1X73_12740 [Pseudomonas sp. FW305-130]POA73643.1 hypothetical protein C1890_27130 [Pseudomonas sp. DP16D-R1]
MTITAQAPTFGNWLTPGDFLNFAKKIWAPVTESNIEAMERKVDDLYGAACKRYPTYDTMVHNAFCASMDSAFGTDEQAEGVAEVFAYARDAYGYMSASEREAQRQEDADNGICSHGLDSMTCPCGCFEND